MFLRLYSERKEGHVKGERSLNSPQRKKKKKKEKRRKDILKEGGSRLHVIFVRLIVSARAGNRFIWFISTREISCNII